MTPTLPGSRFGAAMALFAQGVVVAPILGPTLGGWITDNISWPWIFYINVPIGVLGLALAHLFIERGGGRIQLVELFFESPRFVHDGENGFVCDPEPKAIAARIEELVRDKARAAALGQAGQASIASITWEHVAQTLIAALRL